MATNLLDIQRLTNDKRRDTSSNSVNMDLEGFRAVNTTLDMWNQLHDWEWQIDESIVNYNEGITYYAIPARFKAAVDVRPYKATNRKSEFSMTSPSSFDSETLKTKRFAVTTLQQTEYLRIKAPGEKAQIHTLGDTSDGTWSTANNITTMATDSYESFDLNSSVKFTLTGGQTATIDINFEDALDLAKYEGRSSIYWNANFPSWTNWTNMSLRIGHDLGSHYWTATVTSDYLSRTPVAGQWNRFGLAWSDLTKVGSPSASIIGSARLVVTYSADPDDENLRIENLFISENVPLLFEHYKTDMVVAIGSGSARTQRFSSSANTSDQPLWGAGTGKYDWVNESFVDSVMEQIFFITGEYTDYQLVQNKIAQVVDLLKKRIPSRRRYPEYQMRFGIN